jgi:uncharacterized protein (DUF983 family)
MTHSVPQRIAIIFPLIGAAFLLAALFVPVDFAAAGWAAAVICFAVALVGGIVARRRRKAEVAQRP